jgi:hypothetical protein
MRRTLVHSATRHTAPVFVCVCVCVFVLVVCVCVCVCVCAHVKVGGRQADRMVALCKEEWRQVPAEAPWACECGRPRGYKYVHYMRLTCMDLREHDSPKRASSCCLQATTLPADAQDNRSQSQELRGWTAMWRGSWEILRWEAGDLLASRLRR